MSEEPEQIESEAEREQRLAIEQAYQEIQLRQEAAPPKFAFAGTPPTMTNCAGEGPVFYATEPTEARGIPGVSVIFFQVARQCGVVTEKNATPAMRDFLGTVATEETYHLGGGEWDQESIQLFAARIVRRLRREAMVGRLFRKESGEWEYVATKEAE